MRNAEEFRGGPAFSKTLGHVFRYQKGGSDWSYAAIPVIGLPVGGALAGMVAPAVGT